MSLIVSLITLKCNMKLNNYPFKGLELSELAKAWNIPYDSEQCIFCEDLIEHRYIQAMLTIVLQRYYLKNNNYVICKIAKDIRLYVSELAKTNHGELIPLWLGMLKIESDYVIIQITISLLEYMWD